MLRRFSLFTHLFIMELAERDVLVKNAERQSFSPSFIREPTEPNTGKSL